MATGPCCCGWCASIRGSPLVRAIRRHHRTASTSVAFSRTQYCRRVRNRAEPAGQESLSDRIWLRRRVQRNPGAVTRTGRTGQRGAGSAACTCRRNPCANASALAAKLILSPISYLLSPISYLLSPICSITHACITGFPATIPPCPTLAGSPFKLVTTPPASRINTIPAALSHGASVNSQNASN